MLRTMISGACQQCMRSACYRSGCGMEKTCNRNRNSVDPRCLALSELAAGCRIQCIAQRCARSIVPRSNRPSNRDTQKATRLVTQLKKPQLQQGCSRAGSSSVAKSICTSWRCPLHAELLIFSDAAMVTCCVSPHSFYRVLLSACLNISPLSHTCT